MVQVSRVELLTTRVSDGDSNQLSYTCISLAALQAAHTMCGTKTIVIREVVPPIGLEPIRYFYRSILSAVCLPFHHGGIGVIVLSTTINSISHFTTKVNKIISLLFGGQSTIILSYCDRSSINQFFYCGRIMRNKINRPLRSNNFARQMEIHHIGLKLVKRLVFL